MCILRFHAQAGYLQYYESIFKELQRWQPWRTVLARCCYAVSSLCNDIPRYWISHDISVIITLIFVILWHNYLWHRNEQAKNFICVYLESTFSSQAELRLAQAFCENTSWHWPSCNLVWVNLQENPSHPILWYLPTKLVEWISEILHDELGFPDKCTQKSSIWTPAERNNTLQAHVMNGSLDISGFVEWESLLFRGVNLTRWYPLNLSRHHFHSGQCILWCHDITAKTLWNFRIS